MQDKYTIRDFLVYFITGLYLLLTTLYCYKGALLNFLSISPSNVKDYSAIIIFFMLPGLYILGHAVHGVDLIIFKIGNFLLDFKKKHVQTLSKYCLLKIIHFLCVVVTGNRIAGILNSKNITSHIFWKMLSRLQYEGKSEKAEYWVLMADLFKGLTQISFWWSIYYLKSSKAEFTISIVLTVLFWFRGRHMATNFVSTVNNTYEVRNEQPVAV